MRKTPQKPPPQRVERPRVNKGKADAPASIWRVDGPCARALDNHSEFGALGAILRIDWCWKCAVPSVEGSMQKKNIQRALLERFLEKTEKSALERVERITDDQRLRGHAQRFAKMAENRRQQILDKLLMD